MKKKRIFEAVEFLTPKVGDEIVVYDVESRRIYFLHCSEKRVRIKFVRNRRGKVTLIRQGDRFIRIEKDGSFSFNKEGFAVE